MSSEDQPGIVELRVHFEYLRNDIKALHNRLDGMATKSQLDGLEKKVDHIAYELEKKITNIAEEQSEISKLVESAKFIERAAKWVTALGAGAAVLAGLFKYYSL